MTNRLTIVEPGKGGGGWRARERERSVGVSVRHYMYYEKKCNGTFYSSKASQSVPARPSGEGNFEAK